MSKSELKKGKESPLKTSVFSNLSKGSGKKKKDKDAPMFCTVKKSPKKSDPFDKFKYAGLENNTVPLLP